MGSRQFGAIRFVVYSNDHRPRHLHGFADETEAIVDLLASGNIALAKRADAIRPLNAKRSGVKKIPVSAAENFEALVTLWEGVHGKS